MPLVVLALSCAGACAAASAPKLACEAGTVLRQEASESWCETAAGVMQGPFWARYTNGRLRYYGTAQAGRTEGLWTSFHEDGSKAIEAEYVHGELCGSFREWDAAGHLTNEGRHDAAGEMDGSWTRYWPNGTVRTRWTMRHGRQDGPVATWYESGARKMEGQRVADRPDGSWIWWDEHGAIEHTCRYANGQIVAGDCGGARSD